VSAALNNLILNVVFRALTDNQLVNISERQEKQTNHKRLGDSDEASELAHCQDWNIFRASR
jgi:hypothetical protein